MAVDNKKAVLDRFMQNRFEIDGARTKVISAEKDGRPYYIIISAFNEGKHYVPDVAGRLAGWETRGYFDVKSSVMDREAKVVVAEYQVEKNKTIEQVIEHLREAYPDDIRRAEISPAAAVSAVAV